MKRFMKWIALLAMMTLILGALAACGGSDANEAPAAAEESSNAVSGNWYLVDSGDVTTLKLDAEGSGSLAGNKVTYELNGESLSLTIDGEAIDLNISEDINYGTVLTDGTDIFAYRDKDAAKDVAANGEIDKSQETGPAEEAESSTAPAPSEEPESSAATDDSKAAESEQPAAPSDSSKDNAYVGNWVGESFQYSGVDMSLDEAGMTFSIEFKADGTAVATTNGEADGSATYVINSDGSVTLTDGTGQLPENSYIDDSGLLHLGLDAEEGTMWILCHKE